MPDAIRNAALRSVNCMACGRTMSSTVAICSTRLERSANAARSCELSSSVASPRLIAAAARSYSAPRLLLHSPQLNTATTAGPNRDCSPACGA